MCTVGVDNSVTIVVENFLFIMCPSNKDPLVVYQLNNGEMSHTDSEEQKRLVRYSEIPLYSMHML